MPYKFNINGVTVEAESAADALALAKVLAAAAKPAWPLPTSQAPARTPTNEGGVASPQQPASNMPSVQAAPTPGQSAPPPRRHPVHSTAKTRLAEVKLAVQVLTTIAKHGLVGTDSQALQPLLGGELIAVGSKMRPIKRVIETLGYASIDDVYHQERVDNRSLWYPGPHITEAIFKAQEAAAVQQT